MLGRMDQHARLLPASLLAALLAPTATGMGPPFCGQVELHPQLHLQQNLQLICDDDTGHATIAAIPFASFGTPGSAAPSCAHPVAPTGCHLDNATVAAAVEKLCVGERNCVLPVGATWPAGGAKHCPGPARFFVQARCSSGVGHTVQPHDPPPSPPHPPTHAGCDAALRTWRAALGARVPLSAAQQQQLPFSFRLGGASAATLLPSWDCAATDTTMSDGRRALSLRWTSPTLFAVTAVVTLWPDSAAVESLLRFANHNTSHNSPLLTEANALDTTWALPADAKLETSSGSSSSSSDFTAVSVAMPAGTSVGFRPDDYYDGPGPKPGTNRYAPAGRSSNGKMPFWALESETRGAGLFIALGWSGQWNATFNSTAVTAAANVEVHEEDESAADDQLGLGGGCADVPRPKAPCPGGWWADKTGICQQGCPSGAQGRDPHSGRCLCGKVAPDSKCELQWSCVDGLCCGGPAPPPPGPAVPVEIRATASLEGASFVLLPGESVRSLRMLVTSYDKTELSADYGKEQLPLHDVGLTVLRRGILRHYAVRDPAGELFFPKIAALGYPADVSTGGHEGELWVFDISEENQMEIMHAVKTHEADIEEHWCGKPSAFLKPFL